MNIYREEYRTLQHIFAQTNDINNIQVACLGINECRGMFLLDRHSF